VRRPVVLLTGPRLAALSGVSTHVDLLLASDLALDCSLIHRYSIRRLAAQLGALYASLIARGRGSDVARA
jgi:hypothetical protein